MKTIDLFKSQSVSDIHRLYDRLYESTSPLQLRLPSNIENSRICSRGELIQFILTWSARFPESPISTYLQAEQIDQGLANLFNEDFGFTAALCAQTHGLLPAKSFLDRANKTIPNSTVYKHFKENLDRFNDYRLKNYRAYFLINDWIERKYPANSFANIYRRKLRETTSPARSRFRSLVHGLYDKMTPGGADLFLQSRDFDASLAQLTSLFYEVIENADRWGRRDLDEKSVRGAIIHFHGRESVGMESLAQQQSDTPALSNYLQSSNNERYAEISIFDNGPGLATRISGRKFETVNWQYEESMRCFMRWSGSSTKENEGQGLYKVIRTLNQAGGFLQYRSQNLNLYRDFRSAPLDPRALADIDNESHAPMSAERFSEIFYLRDFKSGGSRLLRNHFAIGTLFTFLLPIP